MCCCECKCEKAKVEIKAEARPYIFSTADLVKALTKAEQTGQLDALKRRFK